MADYARVFKVSFCYLGLVAGIGKNVSVTGLTLGGSSAGNYVLASASINGAVGEIDPRTLTASLTGLVSKAYDGTTLATLMRHYIHSVTRRRFPRLLPQCLRQTRPPGPRASELFKAQAQLLQIFPVVRRRLRHLA
jgi:hypothetical protein